MSKERISIKMLEKRIEELEHELEDMQGVAMAWKSQALAEIGAKLCREREINLGMIDPVNRSAAYTEIARVNKS